MTQYRSFRPPRVFSAAKAALDMQMSVSLSFCHSVSHSVSHAYLFVRFTSIFYNSKSDKMKLMQFLKDFKPFNLSQHSCTLVLVILFAGCADMKQFCECLQILQKYFNLMFLFRMGIFEPRIIKLRKYSRTSFDWREEIYTAYSSLLGC